MIQRHRPPQLPQHARGDGGCLLIVSHGRQGYAGIEALQQHRASALVEFEQPGGTAPVEEPERLGLPLKLGVVRERELEDGSGAVDAKGGGRVVERELRERRTDLERPALPALRNERRQSVEPISTRCPTQRDRGAGKPLGDGRWNAHAVSPLDCDDSDRESSAEEDGCVALLGVRSWPQR
jgi:hypothetical protein